MNKQLGVSLSGLMVVMFLIIVVALAGMKVVPSVLEYSKIQRVIKTVAGDPAMKAATVTDVRRAFEKYQAIEDFSKVKPADLDISKEGGDLVLAFAYQDKIPLFGNVSLLIDYEGSSLK